ncbi:MAG: DNA gyrase subunit A [Planctomycetota bacterium]|nr:MAG: DNA gyrase subunit A [Planctomycetota bacterium]
MTDTETYADLLVEEEMKESYLTYAMSVIVSRALPDARDGLKPSQRRILVAMNDLNLGPRTKHRKCAKISGDTAGNYHPHGDQVVYPTLVRLAQPWNMRYPLVNPQGNFGSIDGDPPAAQRYTEARMTAHSLEMMRDIEKDTVDFVPNYDETRTEPVVLPSRFPNLMCNGSSGIAVGMATSIPPHNLEEVCDAIKAIIEDPEITIAELMKIIPGPDFPSGALICGRKGIVDAYETGRGIITVRARAHIEEHKRGKSHIIITEIPYQLSTERIIKSITEGVRKGRLSGISDVANEIGREGMRLVIELKTGADSNVVLNQLFKRTPLQESYSIIMLALVNNRPKTLNLKEMLEQYIEHRKSVIRRRTRYDLDRAEERAHIVEGLQKALEHIDEIIAIIKKSKDVETARDRLMRKFKFTERQAKAILEMRLQRLTGLERGKLEEEYKELQKRIEEYKAILADVQKVLAIIREDLDEIKNRHGDARRTEIVGEVGEINVEDLIAEEDVVVTISHRGYVKRMPLAIYRMQRRGGKGITAAKSAEQDFIEHLFIASTHDYILFFTSAGMVHWLKVYDIPQMSRMAAGRPLVNMVSIQKGVAIAAMVPVRSFDEGYLMLATAKGLVKKTKLSAFGNPMKKGIIAVKLDKDDQLIDALVTCGQDEVVLGTAQGMGIRFHESDVRPMGRSARGVKGVTLKKKNDSVVGMVLIDPRTTLFTVCEKGFGKRTLIEEYRRIRRGGSGIINIKAGEKNGRVVALKSVLENDHLMFITQQGMMVRTPVSGIRVIGRATGGVRCIRLAKGDRLGSVARIVREGKNGDNGGRRTGPADDGKKKDTEEKREGGEEPEASSKKNGEEKE